MLKLKLVVTGDKTVGKSWLCNTYLHKYHVGEPRPVLFDTCSADVMVDGKLFDVTLYKTAGQYNWHGQLPMTYPGTDVFLLCFCVERPESLENMVYNWIEEIRRYCRDTAVVLVACKTDLRGSCHCVTYAEGYAVAREIGAVAYAETSALTQEGLEECFEQAIRSAGTKRKKGGIPYPVMPSDVKRKAPLIEIEKSTFADDWYKALKDSKFHDVKFVVEGTKRLSAHRIVLISASSFFGKVLAGSLPSNSSQQHELNQIDSFSREDINSGKIEGISSVYEVDSQSGQDTIIELSADIKAKTFVKVLKFLYTGLPRLPSDTGEEEIQDLRRVSIVFKLPTLTRICDNLRRKEKFLNPSLGTYHMDEMGKKMKELFFNQEAFADVVFNVEGTRIFAHKVVLTTRNDVLAAMFCGSFAEACGNQRAEANIQNTTAENFLALLEYLYTDHAPLEKGSEGIGVLFLADEYCQTRLVNICELHISKEIDKICKYTIEKAEIDVIGVLNNARLVNAKQLVTFCLYYISINYEAFSKRKEFSDLSVEDKRYVNEHGWPPLSYREEVEEFEKENAKKNCIIM